MGSDRVGGSDRRLDLQGFRAVAVLIVVLFHAQLPFPGGFVGVDVFFVISGFVITGMLSREWRSTGRMRLGSFYWRRFKRLTPALALMIAVTMIVSAALLPPFGAQQNIAKTGLGSMLLVANYVIASTTGGYFDVAAKLNPLLHTWSLAVEEQFYLVFPALLTAGWLLARRRLWMRNAPAVIVGALGLVSLGLMLAYSVGGGTRGPDWLIGFYSTGARIWEFTAGVLLSLALARLPRPSVAAATMIGTFGAAGLLASLWLITENTTFPGPWTLLPVVATVLIIVAGANSANPVSRALACGPAVWIGDRSYSIYLWHWPCIVFSALLWPGNKAVIVAAAAFSLLPAYGSDRWVEQPIRSLPPLPARKNAMLLGAAFVPPLALSALLLVAANDAFWNPVIKSVQASIVTRHIDETSGCENWNAAGPRNGECVWNDDAVGAPIYLVGDSKAGHLSEGLIDAAASLGRPVMISTASACPYLDVYLSLSTPPSWWTPDGCRASFERNRAWLLSAPPGDVLISNNLNYLFWADYSMSLQPSDYRTGVNAKAPVYTEALDRTVRDLQQAGHRVILANPGPIIAWDPQTCSTVSIALSGCLSQVPLDVLEKSQLPLSSAIERVAADTGSAVFDYRAPLCPSGVCRAILDDGTVVYTDGSHISTDASRALSSTLRDALAG